MLMQTSPVGQVGFQPDFHAEESIGSYTLIFMSILEVVNIQRFFMCFLYDFKNQVKSGVFLLSASSYRT